MSTDNKILKKIAKCLRLAKSSNANEASTAMRQAQKLMEQHNISADDVSMADVNECSSSINTRSHASHWVVNLAALVNESFGTESFSSASWDKPTQMVFVGVSPAAEIASYTFNVLHRQLKNERTAYYKKLRGKRVNKIRKADLFALSWLRSVRSQVIKFSGKDNSETIGKYMAVNHKSLTTVKKSIKAKPADYSHMAQGSLAGKGVTLNHAMNGADGVKALS